MCVPEKWVAGGHTATPVFNVTRTKRGKYTIYSARGADADDEWDMTVWLKKNNNKQQQGVVAWCSAHTSGGQSAAQYLFPLSLLPVTLHRLVPHWGPTATGEVFLILVKAGIPLIGLTWLLGAWKAFIVSDEQLNENLSYFLRMARLQV